MPGGGECCGGGEIEKNEGRGGGEAEKNEECGGPRAPPTQPQQVSVVLVTSGFINSPMSLVMAVFSFG